MTSNREIVNDAVHSWANGGGYVTSIFAEDMTWEITDRSAGSQSKKYASTQHFIDEVLHPFGTASANLRALAHICLLLR